MGYTDNMSPEDERVVPLVQELVPGKQISLAHIIANPDKILYTKLGLDPSLDYSRLAILDHDRKPCRNRYYYGRYCHEVLWD